MPRRPARLAAPNRRRFVGFAGSDPAWHRRCRKSGSRRNRSAARP